MASRGEARRVPGLEEVARLPIFRRSPLARAEIALYAPTRAAALLRPAEGRWPEHEAADRLALGIGAAALAAHRLPEPRWHAYRDTLAGVATAVAGAGGEPLPGDLAPLERLGVGGFLAVVPWEGRGAGGVEVQLLEASDGLVPRLSDARGGSGPVKEVAALALVVALAADGDAEPRLRLALGLEGVLAWFRETDRLSPSRDVMRFALAHAAERMHEAGRTSPG